MRGGKYFLNETLVFTSADSGTQESPIVYAAYPGEKPILSGGRKISGWQPYRGKIVQASVPEAKGGKWRFRQPLGWPTEVRAALSERRSQRRVARGLAHGRGPRRAGQLHRLQVQAR